MQKLLPLKRKEISALLEQIGVEYGLDASFMIDKYVFYKSEKNKVYLINSELKDVSLENVRLNSLGLYFCEINQENIRFSVEGSQIIGPLATKNVIELDDETAKLWMSGVDLEVNDHYDGFVILKNNSDYMGCGKYKEGKILTYLSKARRIPAN